MSVELKKIKLELIKMDANIMDAEIRMDERLAEINRIKDSIKAYEDRKKELQEKMEELRDE